MILIADSGSTKTDWALAPSPDSSLFTLYGEADSSLFTLYSSLFTTQGVNPFHQDRAVIAEILCQELLPQLNPDVVDCVCFYGSGVRPELESVMIALLQEAFPQAKEIEAHSDLLGAARALCGHNYGIASILGTGANSCLYDGERIIQNTPALGYILGDEGSGAVLGRRFLNALYKGILSKEIQIAFETSMGLTMASVVDRVYRQPLANRFLASLSEFIHSHLNDEAVREIVIQNFDDFFQKNIVPYNRRDLPVSFVGSIAWHYQSELQESASRQGFTLGTILKSPIEGLLRFHSA